MSEGGKEAKKGRDRNERNAGGKEAKKGRDGNEGNAGKPFNHAASSTEPKAQSSECAKDEKGSN